MVRGEFERAHALLDEALAMRRELGYPEGIAHALHGAGELALAEGDNEQACALFEEVVAIERTESSDLNLTAALHSLGEALRRLGRTTEAAGCLDEALVRTEPLRIVPSLAACLLSLAIMCADESDGSSATVMAAASEALTADAGLALEYDAEHSALVDRLRTREPVGDFDGSWARGRSMGFDDALRFARLHAQRLATVSWRGRRDLNDGEYSTPTLTQRTRSKLGRFPTSRTR